MSTKFLFVDDELNILAGYQRQLHKVFAMETAASGAEALEMIEKSGPYAVIITDMRMPKMNGIEFLNLVRARAPHSVRMMLTGNADQKTAIDAVNEGHIFRFLNKPCLLETMVQALQAGLAQYKLITAEKELLEKTLIGSISVLVDVLSTSEPRIFARGKKLRECVREVASILEYPNRWELEIAALLLQIGSLTMPSDILLKESAHMELSSKEKEILARIPESGRNLLVKIPRLETVAQIIRYQNAPFETHSVLAQTVAGEKIPQGSRILKVLSDLIDLETTNMSRSVAFRVLHSRAGLYDPQVLATLNAYYLPALPLTVPKQRSDNSRFVPDVRGTDIKALGSDEQQGMAIEFKKLLVGDVLTSDIETSDGAVLLTGGSLVTEILLEKLTNYAQYKGIREPIYVAVENAPVHQQAA
jgi:response regulator RpfG family c-di-GMP phosphodiesterase